MPDTKAPIKAFCRLSDRPEDDEAKKHVIHKPCNWCCVLKLYTRESLPCNGNPASQRKAADQYIMMCRNHPAPSLLGYHRDNSKGFFSKFPEGLQREMKAAALIAEMEG